MPGISSTPSRSWLQFLRQVSLRFNSQVLQKPRSYPLQGWQLPQQMQPGPPKYSSCSKQSLAPGQVIQTAKYVAKAEASKGRGPQKPKQVTCRALPTSSQTTPSHSLWSRERGWLPHPHCGTRLPSITLAPASSSSPGPGPQPCQGVIHPQGEPWQGAEMKQPFDACKGHSPTVSGCVWQKYMFCSLLQWNAGHQFLHCFQHI